MYSVVFLENDTKSFLNFFPFFQKQQKKMLYFLPFFHKTQNLKKIKFCRIPEKQLKITFFSPFAHAPSYVVVKREVILLN